MYTPAGKAGPIMGTPAAGGRAVGRRPKGFRSLRQRVFIRSLSDLVKYVGGHNISTRFYNLPNPPQTLLNFISLIRTNTVVN